MSSGSCACGAVRYVVDGPLRDVYNCHCDRCRRVTGHHMAATATTSDRLSVSGSEHLRWWSPDDSVGYGFCMTCGSTLFWRVTASPSHVSIAAGTLDSPTGLVTTKAWWCETASDYHVHPAGLEVIPREG